MVGMLTAHQKVAILRRLPGWSISEDGSLNSHIRLASPDGVTFQLHDERLSSLDPREGYSIIRVDAGYPEVFDIPEEAFNLLRPIFGAIDIHPSSLPSLLSQHRAELLSECGHMFFAADVGRLLGISPQEVDQRRAAWKLLAVSAGGDWRYPIFQFAGAGVLPGFEEVLAGHVGRDPWATLDSILAKDPSLGDRSLLDALKEGDTETVDLVIRQMQGDGFA